MGPRDTLELRTNVLDTSRGNNPVEGADTLYFTPHGTTAVLTAVTYQYVPGTGYRNTGKYYFHRH